MVTQALAIEALQHVFGEPTGQDRYLKAVLGLMDEDNLALAATIDEHVTTLAEVPLALSDGDELLPHEIASHQRWVLGFVYGCLYQQAWAGVMSEASPEDVTGEEAAHDKTVLPRVTEVTLKALVDDWRQETIVADTSTRMVEENPAMAKWLKSVTVGYIAKNRAVATRAHTSALFLYACLRAQASADLMNKQFGFTID
jgi:hypothetical protein